MCSRMFYLVSHTFIKPINSFLILFFGIVLISLCLVYNKLCLSLISVCSLTLSASPARQFMLHYPCHSCALLNAII